MDQAQIAAQRKKLEDMTTEELQKAFDSQANRPPEEREALRQLLAERRHQSFRPTAALVSAVVLGVAGAACTWWLGAPDIIVVLAGIVCAVLGFASFYVPGIIPRV